MAEKTMVEAIRDALSEEMRRDERVFVLGEDVGGGGVFRATDGLRDEFGEERCMDTPLAEAAIVGAAIGASINGLLPVAEIQFADFIHPAFDQIVSEAARLHYRSNGAWSCPITVRTPYGAGIHGGPYHSQSIEAFYAHVPGLKVICVASPYDAKGLLKSAIRDPNPVVFLEHKKAYRLFREEVPDDDYTIPIGAAETKREGLDMTLVTYGLMTRYSLEAAEEVQGDGGVSVEVIDLRTVSPWDKEHVLESVRKTGKALIVYEDNISGGFGAEVAATIAEDAFEFLDGPVTRIASPDVPLAPYSGILEEHILPNAEKIAAGIRKLAAF
ncbi:MAG: alpha-ketoacid dehydrogenase subunit beta [Chloroflexi bacterium]|nr:alpha-ketoacid dehydrogenase subunit beta [Chloroflexota bacterium]MCI0784113.1 alpha-ketoacid dehydrogenase subunit beta [Chloroflexota bacterium]MCI0814560.1 alpha-ketoacid dehydrogenase subunit beta [Chloroflexota bacterium]MCI0817885.1 alpha-ketoacid dehydrogenase subunit beta [Chloroflexota bacterium]MCI0819993.1 alpha-ketoacid dehydrogenase subunit beta [Chloroflexota bacterium]